MNTTEESASKAAAHVVIVTSCGERSIESMCLRRSQVLHAGGNALTLVLAALVWFSWRVLADFRDAMLMALLCSVALRDVRDTLVASWRDWLSADRCPYARGPALLVSPPARHDVSHDLPMILACAGRWSCRCCCWCGCLSAG